MRVMRQVIFAHNDPESVEIAYMEVPCCSRLTRVAQEALRAPQCSREAKATPIPGRLKR